MCNNGNKSTREKSRNEKSPQIKIMGEKPRFFKTKKQSRVRSRLSIPSQTDATKSRQQLISRETTCCGVSFKQNDDKTEEYVDWVQCCSCDIWVHVTCATRRQHTRLQVYSV